MPLGLKAIIAKKRIGVDPLMAQAGATKALLSYVHAVNTKMAKYPAQSSTTYVRTGDYGRFWNAPGAISIRGNTATVVNRVTHEGRSYAVYVGGPRPGGGPGTRQTAVMRRKGWPSITDVARAEVKAHRPIVNRAIVGRAI